MKNVRTCLIYLYTLWYVCSTDVPSTDDLQQTFLAFFARHFSSVNAWFHFSRLTAQIPFRSNIRISGSHIHSASDYHTENPPCVFGNNPTSLRQKKDHHMPRNHAWHADDGRFVVFGHAIKR